VKDEGARTPLPRNVVALAVVSFLTDVSSDMIYPLLPQFLTAVLGASATTLGAIEGAAESLAALLKLASGWWSDRLARRKPMVVVGYVLASAARPLVAVATSAGHVLAIRLTDRIGKGVRTSPRDALIADSIEASQRGRAFGFHRAADNAGAAVGPLLATALLLGAGLSMRSVFWIAAIPGALAVLTLVAFVREAPRAVVVEKDAAPRGPLGSPFWKFLAVLLVFTLGNSTDAFLLLRAGQLGVPLWQMPLLWAVLHFVKSAASTPGGALSDRLGRRPLVVGGWMCYAAVYVGFAEATETWHAWALFAAYGVFFGMTEGTEKALVADLVPAARRGTAYGFYNLAIGLAALPASLLFGLVWDGLGAEFAFAMGAALAMVAAAGMVAAVRETRTA
jgi:MFS family permease